MSATATSFAYLHTRSECGHRLADELATLLRLHIARHDERIAHGTDLHVERIDARIGDQLLTDVLGVVGVQAVVAHTASFSPPGELRREGHSHSGVCYAKARYSATRCPISPQ
jgi:hypothetical protein